MLLAHHLPCHCQGRKGIEFDPTPSPFLAFGKSPSWWSTTMEE